MTADHDEHDRAVTTGMVHVALDENETSTKSLLKLELTRQIKAIFALQEERVLIGNDFDVQFKEYLLEAPNFELNKLQLICKAVSERMNKVTQSIMDIKVQFSDEMFAAHALHKLVEQLQTLEATKFKATLELFIAEQERLEKLETTDEFEAIYIARIKILKQRISETKLEINDCLEELRYEM